jgi:hypothetical protein
MVLKFMTMNTEDEKRDEIEAIQVIFKGIVQPLRGVSGINLLP